jgi:hypothetical protein
VHPTQTKCPIGFSTLQCFQAGTSVPVVSTELRGTKNFTYTYADYQTPAPAWCFVIPDRCLAHQSAERSAGREELAAADAMRRGLL